MAKLYLGSREITPIKKIGVEKPFNVDGNDWLGEVNSQGELVPSTKEINLVFNSVKDLSDEILYEKFAYNTLVKSLSFPDLEVITGYDCVYIGFSNCYNLETISIPKLRIINGETAFAGAFVSAKLSEVRFESLEEANYYGAFLQAFVLNQYLTKVYFPKLNSLGEYCFYDAFEGCINLEDMYFNSLNSNSFGSHNDQFVSMLDSTRDRKTHTIHFPSNLQPTIENLIGYPTFGGNSSYVVLAFDLPETE